MTTTTVIPLRWIPSGRVVTGENGHSRARRITAEYGMRSDWLKAVKYARRGSHARLAAARAEVGRLCLDGEVLVTDLRTAAGRLEREAHYVMMIEKANRLARRAIEHGIAKEIKDA